MPQPASPRGLRQDYETTLLTIAELAAKYDLTTAAIATFRREEAWQVRDNSPAALRAYTLARAVKRLDLAAASPADDSDQTVEPYATTAATGDDTSNSSRTHRASARKASTAGGTPAHRRTLMRRLYDAVDGKLAELEQRIATRTRLSGAETEREVRQLGNLIKTFEKLTELSDAESRPAARGLAAATAATALADTAGRDDAERLRQDLVERFAQLRQPRAD